MANDSRNSLKLVVARDYDALSRQAARVIITDLARNPDLLLCASAGGSPSGLYSRLAEESRQQRSLFKSLRVVQIDEWHGVPPGHPGSCRSDLESKLIRPAGIGTTRFFAFNGGSKDPAVECERMARLLRRNGPIGICILGLGANGHVAMNEPAGFITSGVHVSRLTRASQRHPLLGDVHPKPKQGLTLGMGDILKSRKVLLLVSGRHKRAALERLLHGPITPRFPASLLWLHGDATVLCDSEAGKPSS
jgi:galactosamine-6-phosphate isomerase